MEKKNTHIYIKREMGSSYTFLGPLICIRSKGEKKKIMVMSLLFPRN